MNRVILCGNLGRDPELRHTKGGTAVANFSVATSTKRKDGDHTEWHNVIVWDKLAEVCAKYLSKGKKVIVEGSIQTRTWDDKDGVKRFATEIIANSVEFLSPSEQAAKPANPAESFEDPALDSIPF